MGLTAEESKARMLQKFTCPCGGKFTYRNKGVHSRTQKHKLYIEKETKKDAEPEPEKLPHATQADVDKFFKVEKI
jgi:hypothetical protein